MNRFLLLLFVLAPMVCFGQSKQKMKKADRHFHNFEYAKAAELYEEILEKHNILTAKTNLAECYRLNNQFDKAEFWYSQVVGRRSIDPIFKLRYGQMLQSTGQCEEAEYWFGEYARLRPSDSRGQRFESSCREIAGYFKEDDRYTLDDPGFNSEFTDFGTAFFDDGMVFLSSRVQHIMADDVHEWNGEPFLNFFYVPQNKRGFGEPREFGGRELNSRFHEGSLVFSPDEKKVYFTRNNQIRASEKKDNTRTVRLKILTAEKLDKNSWTKPRELTFNSDVYNTAMPAISPDGQIMVFSCTKSGYEGGADLFMSRWNGKRWGKPENLGPQVNTEGDEVFPFIHADGTLYFASDGHAGIGGLDVFKADTAGGKWADVVNMGFPLNTQYDDFAIIWDEERKEGYVSSNRPGGAGGDDIYSFVNNYVTLTGVVYDKYTNEPLADAAVKMPSRDKFAMTDEKGEFSFEVPRSQAFNIVANKHGYLENSKIANTPAEGPIANVRIPLEVDGIRTVIRVINASTKQPLADAEIVVTDLCGNNSSTFITDQTGVFVSQMTRGCDYTLIGNRLGYFESVMDVSHKLMEDQPELEVVVEMEPFKTGTVVELENIYYDFNKAYIREDAVADLIKLAEMLNANPELTIELGAHTDARGTAKYNRDLSQRRAQSAMTYLFELGIDPRRITAVGYGEDQVRNQCKDNVPCSDEEHQFNRRTEFKVTGTDGSWTSKDAIEIPVNTWKRAN